MSKRFDPTTFVPPLIEVKNNISNNPELIGVGKTAQKAYNDLYNKLCNMLLCDKDNIEYIKQSKGDTSLHYFKFTNCKYIQPNQQVKIILMYDSCSEQYIYQIDLRFIKSKS